MPQTELGERVYAIGDVHGCLTELHELLDKIAQDHAGRSQSVRTNILFLGDLIDRGPKSNEVLDFVFKLADDNDNVFVIRGNHEQAFSEITQGDHTNLSGWLKTGGRATLRSYGIDPDWAMDNPAALTSALRKAVPDQQLRWLKSLPLSARSGDYFFCHAGVRPGIKLIRQRADDLLWIRDEFMSSKADHGAVIVHGHSIVPAVGIRRNRISVDTGAYKTGRLSAVLLDGADVVAISTPSKEARPISGPPE